MSVPISQLNPPPRLPSPPQCLLSNQGLTVCLQLRKVLSSYAFCIIPFLLLCLFFLHQGWSLLICFPGLNLSFTFLTIWSTSAAFSLFFFLNLFIYLFWLRWVFVAVRGFSLVAVTRGYSSLQCVGFSSWWLLLLWSTGSRCASFSSCGTQAQ